MAVGNTMDNKIPLYVVYGVEAIYALFYAIFQVYHHKVIGRIIFIFGECLMVAVYSFFLFKK